VPDAALLLVGDGPMRPKLERMVDELALRDDVVFTGAIPWDDLPPYFAAGDVFCMPCRTRKLGFEVEGLGIVYLEASATGLPVIAGSSGGAPDTVVEGETGLVVDGRSPESVSRGVADVLTRRALASWSADRGRRWVEDRWSWRRTAGRLVASLS
jgi:phosphatidylinositol alpha-1,6-mannosyltransferase